MNATLPQTMRAWRVSEITDPPTLRLVEIDVPKPGPDQYLVRVTAAGLVFGDTLMVRGRYQTKPPLPFTPGSEVVGTIAASGGGAIAVGTRVCSSSRQGGYAEYTLVPQSEAVEIDTDMPAGTALALRSNYPTSLYSLRDAAHLKAGETLLVHAGAGGVGAAAVQLGKLFGARVIATAGGAEKVRLCLEIGADEAIDYSDGDWVKEVRRLAPGGVDVIYDPVGGEIGAQSLRCLAYGARYLVIGFAGGTLTQLPANRLLLHNASAIGVLWGEARKRDAAFTAGITSDVYRWYREGRLAPPAGPEFPFEQAREALAALEGRVSVGKVVLRVAADQ
jgi:NADPH2:quinone reductase